MPIQDHATVGDIAALSLAAVNVLEEHGIDYCCAGKRAFDDVCREKGLSAEELKAQIDRATGTLKNASTDWNTARMRDLIRHIVSTHHEFLKLELPRIGQRVVRVLQAHGAKDPATLNELQTVYQALWQELDLHMHKEELMLFPAIERYEVAVESRSPLPPAPFGSIANPIAVMEREHSDVGDALRRIRELTRDFLPPEYACATYRSMLDGLKGLEADLHTHIHLENNILFPRVIALEHEKSRA